MKINAEEQKGEESLNTLLELTTLNIKFIEKTHPVIKALEELGVFD